MNLKQLKEARAAAWKAVQATRDAAAESGITDEQRTERRAAWDSAMDEFESLSRQVETEERSRRIDDEMSRGDSRSDGGDEEAGDTEARSLGEHFIRHAADQLENVRRGSRFNVSTPEFRVGTPVVTTGLTQTQYAGPVQLPLRRPTVADLLLPGTMGGNALTYFVEGAITGGPAAVAENGTKPELSGQFTPVTESMSKVAGWSKESDELIEDFEALASIVENRLISRVDLVEEDQILNGSGTSPNLRGLLNRVGIQTITQAVAPDSAQDAIFRAMTAVQTATFLNADFIVINPVDYQALRLSKDANGQYYGGGFFTGEYGVGGVSAQPPLWGMNTVVTSAIAAKTVLVGSGQAAQVFRKGGIRVDVTNSNEDDFINDRITVRAEKRLLLACYRPPAFVKVTLL